MQLSLPVEIAQYNQYFRHYEVLLSCIEDGVFVDQSNMLCMYVTWRREYYERVYSEAYTAESYQCKIGMICDIANSVIMDHSVLFACFIDH